MIRRKIRCERSAFSAVERRETETVDEASRFAYFDPRSGQPQILGARRRPGVGGG